MREIREAYQGILELMTKFIDSVDRYTENHSRRVADYSVEVARNLGLGDTEIEDIRVGAWLHDIGKVDVSIEVLRKAAGLTPEEREEMSKHVERGENLVRSMGGILKDVDPDDRLPPRALGRHRIQGASPARRSRSARGSSRSPTPTDAIVTDRPYREGRTARGSDQHRPSRERAPVRPQGGRGVPSAVRDVLGGSGRGRRTPAGGLTS